MGKITVIVLSLLSMSFASSSYAMDRVDSDDEDNMDASHIKEPAIVLISMKIQYPELFAISFKIADFEVRPFVFADFTDEICGSVFSSDPGSPKEKRIGTMESLASVLLSLDKPCLGVFRESTEKCIGTISLSISEYFNNALKSNMRLINEDGIIGRETIIRKALHSYLKKNLNKWDFFDIHHLEVSFANKTFVIGTEAETGLIRYVPNGEGAPQFKDEIELSSGAILYYYLLKDA